MQKAREAKKRRQRERERGGLWLWWVWVQTMNFPPTSPDDVQVSEVEIAARAEREEDLKFCEIGISQAELQNLSAQEVVTSGDHVSYDIGNHGHYTLQPLAAKGVKLPASCHVSNIDTTYSLSKFASPRQPPIHVAMIQDTQKIFSSL